MGCGTVFMVSIFLMVWVTGHYIYSSYWVTAVGTTEYVDALELLENKSDRIDEYKRQMDAWKKALDAVEGQQREDLSEIKKLQDEVVKLQNDVGQDQVDLKELKAYYYKSNPLGVEKDK